LNEAKDEAREIAARKKKKHAGKKSEGY